VKNEKQDRKKLCKDATVSLFLPFAKGGIMKQGCYTGLVKSKQKSTAVPLTASLSDKAKSAKCAVRGELTDDIVSRKKNDFFSAALATYENRDGEFLIRGLDIAGSITIFFVSMPIMLIAALLMKIASPGPVLYKQKRVGKDGKLFTLYKLRTMVNNAEENTGPVWADENDSRVTPIGRFLRRTRLDELPQLINVLQGDMSLVGPRPERPFFVKRYNALQGIRLAVKPGLTGLAQVRNRYDLRPEHKLKYDYLYIKKRSLPLNLYILLKTVLIIFSKNGW